MIKNKPWMT
jgi:hypothetical protein